MCVREREKRGTETDVIGENRCITAQNTSWHSKSIRKYIWWNGCKWQNVLPCLKRSLSFSVIGTWINHD